MKPGKAFRYFWSSLSKKRLLRAAKPIVSLILISVPWPAWTRASEDPLTTVPPIRVCQTGEIRDLGAWDDVFRCEDQEMLLLWRGEDLFALLTAARESRLKKLRSSSNLARTRMVASARSARRLWLFLESDEAFPFAIDVRSGMI